MIRTCERLPHLLKPLHSSNTIQLSFLHQDSKYGFLTCKYYLMSSLKINVCFCPKQARKQRGTGTLKTKGWTSMTE
jgi:hypothetical protein